MFSMVMLGVMVSPLATQAQTGSVSEAANLACQGAGGSPGANGQSCSSADNKNLGGIIKAVVNILIFIVGVVAVIMLIIGGFRYVLSGGDSAGVEGAKNTILYAIIGVIVAIMAYAVVNFVITNVNKP